MHPDVREAARGLAELTKNGWVQDSDEACARRVLLAQAKPEAIPDGAIEAAIDVSLGADSDWRDAHVKVKAEWRNNMRAALSAALLHIAGEK